ncbi:MAG: Holliday junction branch migration protein RuvA [Firmicutes bacterium]|jgi:Holliday junction DNA helicase RuvA|nr:Holliday junction branch migration protein RuvA [Bacillota bacterium]
MIHYIKGTITEKEQGYVIIENSGMGFLVYVPLGDAAYLENDGPATLYTSMQVKEDDISLYGFSDRTALKIFEMLITVSGVGAKAAMSILSALTPAELKKAVIAGDIKAISSANGVGKKTAERVVLELRDKIAKLEGIGTSGLSSVIKAMPIAGERAKAVSMLIATGASRADAERAVAAIEDDGLKAGQYFMQAAKTFK